MKSKKSKLTELSEKFAEILNKAAEQGKSPPNYRPAEEPETKCRTCHYYENLSSLCTLYDTKVDADYVCDSFKRKDIRKTRVKAVTDYNYERPDLLTKLSALLTQAQMGAPMPAPGMEGQMPPAGMGGAPPQPAPPPEQAGGGVVDLGTLLGLGGGAGQGAPQPMPEQVSPFPPDQGSVPPPPPPDQSSTEEEQDLEKDKDLNKKLDELIGKVDTLISKISDLVIALGGKKTEEEAVENKEKPDQDILSKKTASVENDVKVVEELIRLLQE